MAASDQVPRHADPPGQRKEHRVMTSMWSPGQLRRLDASAELEIAVQRLDGTMPRWVPIWVVCVGRDVFVRTWYRRPSGWFGQVQRSHRARIRVSDVDVAVAVTDVAEGSAELRLGIDNAYRAKYGHYGHDTVEQMVSDAAAATTLRLIPT
jgi:hypothetical protein